MAAAAGQNVKEMITKLLKEENRNVNVGISFLICVRPLTCCMNKRNIVMTFT